jgi:hypothetical protein
MRQISPGIYVDAENTWHFDRDELCIACHVAVSNENAHAIIDGIRTARRRPAVVTEAES